METKQIFSNKIGNKMMIIKQISSNNIYISNKTSKRNIQNSKRKTIKPSNILIKSENKFRALPSNEINIPQIKEMMKEHPTRFKKYIKMPSQKFYKFISNQNNQVILFKICIVLFYVYLQIQNVTIYELHNLKMVRARGIETLNDFPFMLSTSTSKDLYVYQYIFRKFTFDETYKYRSISTLLNDSLQNTNRSNIWPIVRSFLTTYDFSNHHALVLNLPVIMKMWYGETIFDNFENAALFAIFAIAVEEDFEKFEKIEKIVNLKELNESISTLEKEIKKMINEDLSKKTDLAGKKDTVITLLKKKWHPDKNSTTNKKFANDVTVKLTEYLELINKKIKANKNSNKE